MVAVRRSGQAGREGLEDNVKGECKGSNELAANKKSKSAKNGLNPNKPTNKGLKTPTTSF